jgi:hypothetical protein
MSQLQDVNDGKPWSETDLFDLRNSLAYGRSIEEVASFLCRSGTVEEVKVRPKNWGCCGPSKAASLGGLAWVQTR